MEAAIARSKQPKPNTERKGQEQTGDQDLILLRKKTCFNSARSWRSSRNAFNPLKRIERCQEANLTRKRKAWWREYLSKGNKPWQQGRNPWRKKFKPSLVHFGGQAAKSIGRISRRGKSIGAIQRKLPMTQDYSEERRGHTPVPVMASKTRVYLNPSIW